MATKNEVIPGAPKTAQWDDRTQRQYDAAQQLQFEHPNIYDIELVPLPDGDLKRVSVNLTVKPEVRAYDREAFTAWARFILDRVA